MTAAAGPAVEEDRQTAIEGLLDTLSGSSFTLPDYDGLHFTVIDGAEAQSAFAAIEDHADSLPGVGGWLPGGDKQMCLVAR